MDIGGNDGVRAKEMFPNSYVLVLDKKSGFDVEKQELPYGLWDVILANHIIEHLSDPDDFLDKCYRCMNENTVLNISTPNLAAWFNRLLFILGYLPHSYEVSFKHNVGKIKSWSGERLGGHVRLFTVMSLKQLLKKHEFKIIDVRGEGSIYPCNFLVRGVDRLLTNNSNLASSFRIRCIKK